MLSDHKWSPSCFLTGHNFFFLSLSLQYKHFCLSKGRRRGSNTPTLSYISISGVPNLVVVVKYHSRNSAIFKMTTINY